MSHRLRLLFVSVMFLLGSAPALLSQEPQFKPEVYDALKYRYIGPEGNRADAVVGIPGNPNIYYVGAASGGIFKSTDGGIHWDPVFDSEPVASIGSLAVAATDPNIVWAGTGEPYIRSHISVGQGIYKSLDAGKTWKLMGLEKTGRIGNVIIDPRNPDVVLACALGHAYGPQPERGVFRTADGGKTWEKVLFVDENTGCSDLAIDPNNSRILFAGMWQIVIHTWGRTSGGPGSALYKSTDGGVTWKKLEGHGLPHPPIGRIAVRVAQKDSNRVYAEIETGDGVPDKGIPGYPDFAGQLGQLWRSDDGGDSWKMVNSDRQIRGRTHYYTREEISPDNENEVYFMAASFSRTLDGGVTLTKMPSPPGGDHHEMWIDPTNGDRMAVVHDGGVSISVNRGKTWNRVSLPIAQMYHVTVDDQIPYYVYGNRQDGPSWRGPSNNLQFGGFFGSSISRGDWHDVAGGESGFAVPDPADNNIIWSTGTGTGSVGGTVTRFDERTLQHREVEVWPDYVAGDPAADVKYRFNWEFPIAISPFDHNKIYVGSQFVHVTTDGGNSWQIISPDLTRNDKSRMQISGGLTPDDIGVEYAGVIFALNESPKEQGLIWVGTNDGLVHVTRDGGKTWTDVTKNIPNLLEWGTIDNIEPSRYDAGTAYLTVDGHQVNSRDPWVYKTTDFGKTWTLITNGLPHDMLSYAHCVREDPVRKGLLYLGTEGGLYVSFDDGKNWQPLQSGLPHAPVYWLTVQERFHDLAVATYGRGFWILDDITPLQQLTPKVAQADAHLFAPRDAYRFQSVSTPAAVDYDASSGKNPPYGASINFYLKETPKEKATVKLSFEDSSGKTVRTIECHGENSGAPAAEKPSEEEENPDPDATPCEVKAGINRVWWDLRGERSALMKLRTAPLYAPDVTLGPEGWRKAPVFGRLSLLVQPGTYTVTLSVAGRTQSQKLTVRKDPHTAGTDADIQAQLRVQQALWDEANSLATAVNQIESLRVQLASLEKELGSDETSKAVRKPADELAEKLVAVEGKLLQLKLTGRGQDDCRWAPELLQKIDYLFFQLDSTADFPPTTQQTAVEEMLKQRGEEARQEFQKLAATDVAAFNAMLRERGIPNIIARTP
ncbi:MAG TPA: hypothetical protein VLW54_15445 [Candidatus Acidoferrales bacterium]|nr:hypothetical protein [Candidatus Acidoferrales bacterium]